MKPFLSIDVGGSAIKYGVITDGTTFLYRSQCPTPKDSMEDLLDAYRALYADCAAYGPFEGVAISFTASMDGRTGYCFGGSLEKYTKGENLLEVFQSVFEEPVAVENDGNCGALAEGRYGSLAGLESGMVIILGTGLGGGLLTNGHIHRGKRSCSGEFSWPARCLGDPQRFPWSDPAPGHRQGRARAGWTALLRPGRSRRCGCPPDPEGLHQLPGGLDLQPAVHLRAGEVRHRRRHQPAAPAHGVSAEQPASLL